MLLPILIGCQSCIGFEHLAEMTLGGESQIGCYGGGLDGRVDIALDYFDASINRTSAWVTGYRNVQKALLFALLQPNDRLKALQDQGDLTQLMAAQEELKTAPFGEVWDEYCHRCNKPVDGTWFSEIQSYEKRILEERR